jgi:ATP phosphoribosyltransferase regulatory subunit
MADVRIVSALLEGARLSPGALSRIHAALASQRRGGIGSPWPAAGPGAQAAQGLQHLLQLYGDVPGAGPGQARLGGVKALHQALDDMAWLDQHLRPRKPMWHVSFDLADLRGYAYYSGTRFAIYGAGEELARGGRYDEVGAVFGRKRPAAGFSLDLKELVAVLPARPLRPSHTRALGRRRPTAPGHCRLRSEGHTVACVLPGHEHEVNEFDCDRELACVAGQWFVQALGQATA